MDKNEKKALEDIELYGCHILHVLGDSQNPRFSYSIGIHNKTKQPELLITGLKQELCHSIINEYNTRIINGEVFVQNQYYKGFIENYDITFKEVDSENYDEYFGWGLWYYKNKNFKVLQLIYPSVHGKWLWDEDADSDLKWFIPKLWID